MSRPVFVADVVDRSPVTLAGPEGRHAATVRRLRVGEEVDVVDGRGGRARCTVRQVSRELVELDVVELAREPQPALRVVVVQALAKGDRGELAVELCTEVGVDEIVPWSAERCVVRWDGPRGDKALARWRATAREAAKQSRRAWHPEVGPLAPTAQVVQRVRAADVALVLHEAAPTPAARVPLPAAGTVVLVVGPEGGLTPAELAALAGAGGTPVRLGPTVLRTSTAGAVATALVCTGGGRWG